MLDLKPIKQRLNEAARAETTAESIEAAAPLVFEDVPRLLAEVESLRVAKSDWQAIETAPKDGTRVLVWSAAKGPNIAHCGGDKRWHTRGVYLIKATHWMPLPNPPAGLDAPVKE